jgi:hypothetical protein
LATHVWLAAHAVAVGVAAVSLDDAFATTLLVARSRGASPQPESRTSATAASQDGVRRPGHAGGR